MLGIPSLGQRVKLWPAPGKKVQLGERALDSGGRWMSPAGEDVIFSAFHYEQLRAGDIMLHPPGCDEHDFGDQGDDGKLDREHCALCGRNIEAAQKYDIERAPGLDLAKKAAADATEKTGEATLEPRVLVEGEALTEEVPPSGVIASPLEQSKTEPASPFAALKKPITDEAKDKE